MRRYMPVVVLTLTALASAAAQAEDAVAAPPSTPAATAPAPAVPVVRKAAPRKKARAPQPGPWWVSLGVNLAHVEDADKNCPGSQAALAVGGRAFVKLQRTSMSYERSDRTDTCDGLFVGDSSATETALMLGAVSWRSGVFAAVGPARTRFDEGLDQPRLEDTELRYELGWSSRHARRNLSSAGVEVLLFASNNDLHHTHGVAFNVTFGAARR